jgi:alginate O-acetyltransferase complex protein AlgI
LWIGFAIAGYNLVAAQLNIKHESQRHITLRDFIGIFITFQIMAIAWVFFRADSIDQAMQIFNQLMTKDTWVLALKWTTSAHFEVHRWLLFLVVTHIIRGMQLDQSLHQIRHPIIIGIFWGVLLCVMLIFHADITERFIYFQF